MDALESSRCAPKTVQDPLPFPHLKWPTKDNGTMNIKLRITLIRESADLYFDRDNKSFI